MIFITAKFKVKAEHADEWADLTREFTEATRGEPGNLWFDWSRSLDDPTEYVLVEAFRDGDAGAPTCSRPTSPPPWRRCRSTWSRRRGSSARTRPGRLVRARRDARRLTQR